jgi:predicted AAA+ superfamily ATPase
MKKYLIDKKEDIKKLEVVEREAEIKPSKDFAIAVIGPRRAGKTFTCYYLIKKRNLKDEDNYLFSFSSFYFIIFKINEQINSSNLC